MQEKAIREAMVAAGKRLLMCGLNHGAAGNISCRLDDGHILISPTGFDLAEMEPQDMVKLTMNGQVVESKNQPSSEYQIHLSIFNMRPDVGAVIHTHSPYMTAFAVANVPVEARIMPEFVNTVGTLPLVPYQVPHTKELADSVCEAMRHNQCVLMANHGSVTVGKNLKECMNNLEISEFTCKVSILCKEIGAQKTLTVTKAE